MDGELDLSAGGKKCSSKKEKKHDLKGVTIRFELVTILDLKFHRKGKLYRNLTRATTGVSRGCDGSARTLWVKGKSYQRRIQGMRWERAHTLWVKSKSYQRRIHGMRWERAHPVGQKQELPPAYPGDAMGARAHPVGQKQELPAAYPWDAMGARAPCGSKARSTTGVSRGCDGSTRTLWVKGKSYHWRIQGMRWERAHPVGQRQKQISSLFWANFHLISSFSIL